MPSGNRILLSKDLRISRGVTEFSVHRLRLAGGRRLELTEAWYGKYRDPHSGTGASAVDGSEGPSRIVSTTVLLYAVVCP
jgi:hypothetical protein